MPAPTERTTARDPLDVRHDPGSDLPVEDGRAVEARAARWRDGYRPESAEDEWLFEQVVVNSVRVDACQRLDAELRAQAALRARVSWDEDRRRDAEKIGSTLSRDPSRVVGRLLATKQGCEWLLERWRALGAALVERGTWTEAQRVLAVNLLGTPAEFRNDPVWHAPADVVSDEVARLDRLKSTALDPLDALERAAAEKGLAVEPSEALTKVRRYEAACMRQFQWARNRLLSRPADPRAAPPPPATSDDGGRPPATSECVRPVPDRSGAPAPRAAAERVPAQSRADRNQPYPRRRPGEDGNPSRLAEIEWGTPPTPRRRRAIDPPVGCVTVGVRLQRSARRALAQGAGSARAVEDVRT